MVPCCKSLFALVLAPVCIGAFAPALINHGWSRAVSVARHPLKGLPRPAASGLNLSPIPSSDALSSLLISTVDSDIAKMSDNEFAPVFLGGVVVMLGGLFSAIFVGTVVNKKDLAARIVAESYLQGADNEEFWKNMSEEEKRKTQALLQKIKENDNRSAATPMKETSDRVMAAESVAPPAVASATVAKPAAPTGEAAKEVDMFSDY